jgi:hypothetical protein
MLSLRLQQSHQPAETEPFGDIKRTLIVLTANRTESTGLEKFLDHLCRSVGGRGVMQKSITCRHIGAAGVDEFRLLILSQQTKNSRPIVALGRPEQTASLSDPFRPEDFRRGVAIPKRPWKRKQSQCPPSYQPSRSLLAWPIERLNLENTAARLSLEEGEPLIHHGR